MDVICDWRDKSLKESHIYMIMFPNSLQPCHCYVDHTIFHYICVYSHLYYDMEAFKDQDTYQQTPDTHITVIRKHIMQQKEKEET